jgi:hypothetical protein
MCRENDQLEADTALLHNSQAVDKKMNFCGIFTTISA